MPILRFQDDGSIGTALGHLAAGINSINDPKAAMQGEYLRQQIEASKATQAKTLLETQHLRDQYAGEAGVGTAAMGLYDAQNPRPNFQMAPDEQGPPMSAPMQQSVNNTYDAHRNVFNATVRNAALRGGDPMQASRIIPFNMSSSDVMRNGAPTDPARAAQLQAGFTGQLPDANTPLTDIGRQTIGNETLERQKALEGYKISKSPLDLTGGKTYGIPQMDGGIKIFGPEQYGGGVSTGFTGDSELAQAHRLMEVAAVKDRQGTLTQQDMDNYDVAWNRIYGPKTEIRDISGTPTAVQIQNPIPGNRPKPDALRMKYGLQPGLSGGAAPAPGAASTPPVGGPPVSTPSAGAPPVSTDQAPATAPAAMPGGVAVGAPLGAPKPMTQEANKLTGYVSQMMLGHQKLDEIVKQDKLPNVWERLSVDPDTYGKPGENNARRALGTTYLGNTDAKTHNTAAQGFLDGLLRNESGAVINTSEYEKVATYTVPTREDTPSQIATKKVNRELLINAYEKGLLGEDPKVIIVTAKKLIEDNMASQRGAPAPAPAGAPAARDRSEIDALVGFKGR